MIGLTPLMTPISTDASGVRTYVPTLKGHTMGKRGPKRKIAKREPSGKLSRKIEDQVDAFLAKNRAIDEAERMTLKAPLAARHRVAGVEVEKSMDQQAGSFVGRLWLRGELSLEQRYAADRFFKDSADYSRVCASPRSPAAVNLNATRGSMNAVEDEDYAIEVRKRYEAARRAVQDKQNEVRLCGHLFGALQYCVVQDISLPHLVGDLRTALNALVKHYGFDRKPIARRREAA